MQWRGRRETARTPPRGARHQGGRTLWGKNLQRALQDGSTRAQIGDDVGARLIGRIPVTVRRRDVEPGTGEVRVRDKIIYRNRWIVERSAHWERLAANAQAIRENPIPSEGRSFERSELKETYLHLKHAQLLAQSLPEEGARREFISGVREGSARAVEGGVPLSKAQIKAPRRQPAMEQSLSEELQGIREPPETLFFR